MSDTLSTEIGSILFGANRSIGGIIPDLTVREQGLDELEITQHPVEAGATITDHAIIKPPSLTLEYGFSNSVLSGVTLSSLLDGDLPSLDLGNQKVRQVYEQLLTLQKSRVPFQVVTGKRLYDRMLLTDLGVTTDASTENVLSVTATCRQITIVSTTTTTIAPQSQQAMPASTAATVNTGPVQPIAVPSSLSLLKAFGNLF